MTSAVIIRGDQLNQHRVQAAPWTDDGADVSALMRELLAAGTVQRWAILRGALELARREAAAQALELAALAWPDTYASSVPDYLEQRAELHRSGEL